MSRPQQNSIIFANSPIAERSQEGDDEDLDESAVYSAGCGCFRRSLSCFGWRHGGEGSQNYLLRERGGQYKETWLEDRFKSLKEFSELLAGPKWKNFIRRLGKISNPKKETAQFQYSPESYAQNFAGNGGDQEEEGVFMHSFSSRFAAGSLVSDEARRTVS